MDARIAGMEALVRERLGQYVWGTDDETLGSVIKDHDDYVLVRKRLGEVVG